VGKIGQQHKLTGTPGSFILPDSKGNTNSRFVFAVQLSGGPPSCLPVRSLEFFFVAHWQMGGPPLTLAVLSKEGVQDEGENVRSQRVGKYVVAIRGWLDESIKNLMPVLFLFQLIQQHHHLPQHTHPLEPHSHSYPLLAPIYYSKYIVWPS